MKKILSLILVLSMLLCTAALASADELDFGTVNGNVYWNDTLSIGCILNNEWTYATREQLADLNGLSSELVGSSLSQKMRSVSGFTAMFAENTVTGESMNLATDKIGSLNSVMMTEESYLDIGTPDLVDSLTAMGFESVTTKKDTVSFLGEDHAAVKVTATMQGTFFFQTLTCTKADSQMLIASVSSIADDTTENILRCFFNDKNNMPFTLGTNDGNTYSNAFIGLGCTLGSNWEFFTNRQIEELNRDAIVSMDTPGQALDNMLVDMMAENDAANSSVRVNVLQISGMMSPEFVRESTAEVLNTELRNSGVQNIQMEKGKTDFLGKSVPSAVLTGTSKAGALFEKQVVFRSSEKYVVIITATSVGEDLTNDILSAFYQL